MLGIRRFFALGALALLFATPVFAQTYTYSVYVDSDNNASTGCTATFPGGNVAGAEAVLTATIQAGSPPQLVSVTQSTCAGASFGAPVAAGSGAVGVGAGNAGSTAIEVTNAVAALAGANATVRLYVVAQSATGSDVLLNTTGTAGGAPILFAVGSGPVTPGGIIPAPLLGVPAIAVLILILLAFGSRAARRRWMQRVMVGLALVSGVAGAAIFNWNGINPLATDPAGDATSGEAAIDLRSFFAAVSGTNLHFRIDVSGNLAVPVTAPVAIADSYTTSLNTALNTPAPGVLGNDTPNTATISAHTNPAHGTLSLNNDGSFIYTPASGYTGSDSFTYTLTNPAGSSTATVSLNIVAGPVAIADSYTATVGSALSIAAPGVLGNDQLGAPAASLSSFGGGSLGGAVTDHAPGSSATLAGAALTVNADGSINLGAATTPGVYTFQYRIGNSQGTSDGSVTITVNPLPPVANAVTATVAFNSTNNPIALNLSGAAATSVAVSTAAAHGTATASATSITYTPTAGYVGEDSFAYTASNSGGTSAPALVSITVNPAPPIANPVSATVLANSTNNPIALSIAGGAPASVAVSTPPAHGTATSAGTSISYTPNAGYSGADSFAYTASNAGGTSAPATVTLAVNLAPTVTTNPVSQSVSAGSNATFSAAATGNPAPTVQWQVSSDGGTTFTPISGETSTTLTFTGTIANNGYQYQAVFSNAVGTAQTTAATLTVTAGPAITTSPVDTTVNAGATATFTAAATGAPTPTVQWQVSTDGGTSYSDVAGATSTTLSLPNVQASQNGNKYHATFSNASGNAKTTPATLTVNFPPMVTSNPLSQTVAAGSSVTFTVAAIGNPTPTVQWQVSSDGGVTFTDIGGATTTTLSFTAAVANNGNQYQAVFHNASGNATTTAATLTVTAGPAITTSPIDTTVNAGATATFTAAATGSPTPTVQWQVSTDGGTSYSDVAGATTTTLSLPNVQASQNGNKYQATFSNGSGNAKTTPATLTVNFPPMVTSNPLSQTVAAGSSVTFTAAASGNPTPTVRWQFSSDGGLTFTNITGANSSTLTLPATIAENGNQYQAVFHNASGNATTTAATLTVTAVPTITSANTVTFTVGTAGSFTVTTTGTPLPSIARGGVALPTGVTFVDNGTGTGTLSGTPAAGTGGSYAITFTASNSAGSSAAQSFSLIIDEAPSFTSTGGANFTVGSAGTFTVATSGYPKPALTTSSTLPSGVSFTDNGDGTATLGGTPNAGAGGAYPLTFNASNGIGAAATQTFSLHVSEAPTITSSNTTTFAVGSAGSFQVTTTGYPTVTVTESGALPSGVTLGPGGLLSGTPAAGTGGSYALTIKAANSITPNATQNFTLIVNQAPAITSAASASFPIGQFSGITITTTGYPSNAAMAISTAGPLPAGVNLVNNNNGTATLSGTPAANTAGPYTFTIVANNGVAPNASQSFTLTVSCPTITLAPASNSAFSATYNTSFSQTFTPGGGSSPYAYTIAGASPPPSLSFSGNTYGGTPGYTGNFAFTVKATDNYGCASPVQNYTLSVVPVATDDSYTTVGNTQLVVGGSAPSTPYVSSATLLTANDSGPGTLTATVGTAPAHGTVAINAPGGFTYTPSAGYTGADSFTYTITDGSGATSAAATVSLNVTGKVWYVNGAAASNGSGVSSSPFNTLASASTTHGTGDTIFVESGGSATATPGAISIKANATLWGQGTALPTIGGVTIANTGATTKPSLSGTVTLAGNNATLSSLDIATNTVTGLTNTAGITGASIQNNVTVTTIAGTAVNLSNAAGAFTLLAVSASNTTGGIALNNVSGTFSVTGSGTTAGSGGSILNTTSAATGAGAIVVTSTPAAVSLNNMTLGSSNSSIVSGSGVWATDAQNLSIATSTFSNFNVNGIHVTSSSGSVSGTFNIHNNTITGSQGSAAELSFYGSGTWTGHFKSNTIGVQSAANSGSFGGEGIDVNEQGSGTVTADVSNNSVYQINQSYGILAGTTSAVNHLNLTLANNTVRMLQAAGLDGISVSSGFNGSTVCMNATGNNSVAAGTALGNGQFDGVGISVIQNDTSSVFQLQGYAGAPTDTNAVQNFLIGANTLSGANPGDQAYAQLISAGFTSATCATAP